MEKQECSSTPQREQLKRSKSKSMHTSEVHSSVFLSISECKKHLGETNLTDKEVEELRDAIIVLIDNIFDRYFDELNTYDPKD